MDYFTRLKLKGKFPYNYKNSTVEKTVEKKDKSFMGKT